MNIAQEIKNSLRRRPSSHKGDYGRIFVLAGSRGMSGAAYLSSMAALRSGAGLVTVGVPESLVLPLSRKMTEAMMKPLPETKDGTLSKKAAGPIQAFLKTQDVFAIGPGLSQNSETQTLIRQAVSSSRKPMVIDADGLNALKGKTAGLKKLKAPTILTPHPGEFTRIFGAPLPASESARKKRASEVSKKYGIILVLKGHRTVVASPKGEIYINATGNPGMATAGSGDVLTGIVAAMLGQHLPPFQAACFGVYIHGLAGDFAAAQKTQISLVASDIIDCLPKAFRKILN